MSRSVFPFHLPWKSTTPPPPDINTMVDKEDSQQRGRQLGLLSPKKRGQSMHPNGSAQAPQTPPPATRASSTAFGAFMSPLRRLAPAAASVPVPPPKPEPAPMPEVIRAPPSVRIPPIRRMAPQRGTTGRPAREEPLLRPPPPNRQRARNSVERDRTFVTNQCKLLPLYLGRPREEQDRMLERLAPRPRDITFLPPLSMSSGSSSLKLPEEKLLSDIPPPMSLRDDAQVPYLGFDLSSSSSTADASLNMFYSPSTPMFGPPLKQPYPSSAPVTPEENGPRVADLKDQPPVYQLPSNPPLSPERPSFIGSVSNAIPRPQPADQQTDLSLEDPFEHLNSASKPRTPLPGAPLQRSSSSASPVTPSKRHPQLPYPAHIGSSRGRVLSSGRRKSGPPKEISQTKVKPGAYRPRFLPPYRPKTPPAGWFLSQNQVNALCRCASLPEIPIVGDKTFAERSLEENPFRPGPMKRDLEPLPVGPPRKPVNMDTIKPYQPLAAKNDIQALKNGLRPIPSDKFQQKKLASKASEPQARESNPLSFPHDLPQLPARDPIPPVKFVDYTEMPNPQYTKFSHGRGPRILMEKERPGPFGTGEAKVFALKLLTALLPVKNNRSPTAREVQLFAEASDIVGQWLLSYPVNVSPQSTGIAYGIFLFRAATWLGNNWFTVAELPRFLNDNWGMPCANIEGQELSYEWYLKVQDVFFRSTIEAYNNCLREKFVVLGDMAYPINTIVPKYIDGERVGMGAEDRKMGEDAAEAAYTLQVIADGSDRTAQRGKNNLGRRNKMELDHDRSITDALMGDCPE